MSSLIITSPPIFETDFLNNSYIIDPGKECNHIRHETIETIKDPQISKNRCLAAFGTIPRKNYSKCDLNTQSYDNKKCLGPKPDYNSCHSPVIGSYWVENKNNNFKKVCLYDLEMMDSFKIVIAVCL